MAEPEPGWRPDPLDDTRQRYWDGKEWTDQVKATPPQEGPPTNAGWFTDPLDSLRTRWFDGQEWTDQVQVTAPRVEVTHETPMPPLPLPSPPSQSVGSHTATPSLGDEHGPPPSKEKAVFAAVLGLISLLILGGLSIVLLGNRDTNSTRVTAGALVATPAVQGLALADARTLLLEVGLIPSYQPPAIECRGGWPDWQVRKSSPGPEVGVARGSPVRLDVVCKPQFSSQGANADADADATEGTEDEPSTTATQIIAPILSVEEVSASTAMWQVSWERVRAEDLTDSVARKVGLQLDSFSNDGPNDLLATNPSDPSKFASIPGSYEHDLEAIPCPEPLLCLLKRISMNPPGGASGMGIMETLIVNYMTGKRLQISDVVSGQQLPGLTAAVAAAVEASGQAYSGLPVDLDTAFKQFPNFIPTDNGLRLYFSEQEVGPFPVEVFVSWDEVNGSRATAESSDIDIAQALNYICLSAPESKPDLIRTDSDALAVSALQSVLAWKFGENPGPATGQYDPYTITAVKRMQTSLGVVADGQVGPITWTAIQRAVCPRE